MGEAATSGSRVPGMGLGLYEVEKRCLDLFLALLVLVLLSPLWLLVALLVKLTSPGPVFFTGIVVGKGCKPFKYYKFRSMRAGNDNDLHLRFLEGYVRGEEPSAVGIDPETRQPKRVYKVVNDPRITPVGRILRKLSIDEIPQLINVVRGEMSIVGPRPPILHEFQLYDDWAKARLAVLPGITGLAQIRARGRASFKDMVWMDLEYIARRSIALDLSIMLRTIPAVLLGKGAY